MQRAAIPSGNPTPFKAPAHKHAHHLHSIPPREKSTRTLIIDHLLWVHGRTRFAQARAELGMTDRTGGASAANHAHRERPENYEEDEEAASEGEDVRVLGAREGGPEHTHGDDEEDRLERQELALARSLRLRAESVEKVATSMLDQPPEVRPLHPDDLLEPPTSPSLQPQHARQNQHTLPNGVRLRLALATVINDLFSRRAPDLPRGPNSPVDPSIPTSALLPSVLVPLAAISDAILSPSAPRPARKPSPTDYIRSLYNIGTDPDTSNSPPSLRCPRHLHMSCEICVEAKAQFNVRPGPTRGRTSTARAGSTTGSSPGDASSMSAAVIATGVTGWQDGSGIGSGLARPGQKGTVLRRPSMPNAVIAGPDGRGIQTMNNTKLAELIVRFLRLSALVAMELGREATEDRASLDGGDRREEDGAGAGGSSTGGQPQTPRGSVASPQTSPRVFAQRNNADPNFYSLNALRPSREWYFLLAGLLTRAVLEGYLTAQWRGIEPLEVLLGVGLGITPTPRRSNGSNNREGDSSGTGSIGSAAGLASGGGDPEFKDFNPDDLPELEDAARILFPSLREPIGGGNTPVYFVREGAELEYEVEMTERLARFYAVPGSTPDVATHMEDLAWQFPAEAVERAAVRFCEAIAQWRGKPELETYKKASWIVDGKDERPPAASGSGGVGPSSGTAAMSIESLVHSNPTSPSTSNTLPTPVSATATAPDTRPRRPMIDRYFTMPPSFALHGRKRRREDGDRGDRDDGRRGHMPYA
ncbi:uncharacterized protein TRAVEDRAFT_150218 [Trametes versicolor FP-101664 SS1]|uniref:uncharacterized protein n=1 Tax=Trametes versicolor (strain FP-101664) TaxID=717944 RepID=UPI0004621D32|nr:uncharacterized protein TRAVEDRAFT_150218 [Trametes versicolor FP-101664 SS1]EIW57646.1 hypothetical protein TRAVEDRAFT_150218 [Trametes versicolor FP-101664 SS1]